MLIANNITKRYKKTVLNSFSYCFKEGSIYAITGKSGSGKSTLLNILSGNIKKYNGMVLYNNFDIKRKDSYTFNDVSYVYQSYQLFDNMTALENVLLPFELINENIKKHYYQAMNLFEYFNIKSKQNELVKNLSGGEKQRVAIIRALLKNGNVMLFDEPTSALDDNNTINFFNKLNEIKSDKIIIIVTHNNKLSRMCDYQININCKEKIEIKNEPTSSKHDKKLEFSNITNLYNKVFKSRKIFNYLAVSILSLGLVTISLSNIVASFINDVSSESFSYFDVSNLITFKAKSNNINIDFKEELNNKYDYIYYEGINSELKRNIKELNIISDVDFNGYEIENVNMIYDNYMSEYEENIVLAIPTEVEEYCIDKNYLNVYYNSKIVKIPVDKVVYSYDESFCLYSNNVSYLKTFFFDNNIELDIYTFIFSKNARSIYNYLNDEDRFKDYLFLYDEENSIIQIIKSNYSRITKDELETIQKYDGYILSDYINTYIDYDSGFIYVIDADGLAIQAFIDNDLEDNHIKITKRLYDGTKYYTLKDNSYTIDVVLSESTYPLIYMNAKTFTNLNNSTIYSGAFINNKNVEEIEGILLNKNLSKRKNFEVFDYMINFLRLFSIIIIIFASISSISIFTINLYNKSKDIKALIRFGVYKEIAVKLLLFDPIKNIASAIASTLLVSLATKIAINIIYNKMSGAMLVVTISLINILLIILVPLVIILPIIILKIYDLIKSNYNI